MLLAGLLYLGSGLGLSIFRFARDRRFARPSLSTTEWLCLAAAIITGGILGPILLTYGLTQTSAANASLLLNLEAVLSALIAWIVFRENAGRRVVTGMMLIVAGGICLALSQGSVAFGSLRGVLAIAGACLCWAADNNLTRKISGCDAVFVASAKGLVAGTTTVALALAVGATLPSSTLIAAAMIVGLFGYGVSLVLFVLALRGLGTARTSAYFSIAPFLGAAMAVASTVMWVSALLMAIGVTLHLLEQHVHEHAHENTMHTHSHVHDAHHQHEHDVAQNGSEPHSHEHDHEPLTHSHAHHPDIHHRHRHQTLDAQNH